MDKKVLIKEIEELKKEILILKGINQNKSKAFSDVKIKDLTNLVDIKKVIDKSRFNIWFNKDILLSKDIESFLEDLISEYEPVLSNFNEDTLKVKFIGTILNKIKFANFDLNINDFYHSPLNFKNDKLNFNGYCDFYIAKGLYEAEKPYFFIQEYKPSMGGTHPEPQLLAELICAIELNEWKVIKGAYIIGAIWNFVILEKLEDNKYQYFVSSNFDSTDIEKLKGIYKNLLFIKDEIIEMVKKNG
ncbi:MAG: hypothetical protein U9Q30_06000 [Campylobacterota bacterium]|nr:hypothetical protein [Campylobacterota bacterium]